MTVLFWGPLIFCRNYSSLLAPTRISTTYAQQRCQSDSFKLKSGCIPSVLETLLPVLLRTRVISRVSMAHVDDPSPPPLCFHFSSFLLDHIFSSHIIALNHKQDWQAPALVCVLLNRLHFCCCCSLSRVQLFVTPWTAAHQVSLPFTVSPCLLKLLSLFLPPSKMWMANSLISWRLFFFFFFFFFLVFQLLLDS